MRTIIVICALFAIAVAQNSSYYGNYHYDTSSTVWGQSNGYISQSSCCAPSTINIAAGSSSNYLITYNYNSSNLASTGCKNLGYTATSTSGSTTIGISASSSGSFGTYSYNYAVSIFSTPITNSSLTLEANLTASGVPQNGYELVWGSVASGNSACIIYYQQSATTLIASISALVAMLLLAF